MEKTEKKRDKIGFGQAVSDIVFGFGSLALSLALLPKIVGYLTAKDFGHHTFLYLIAAVAIAFIHMSMTDRFVYTLDKLAAWASILADILATALDLYAIHSILGIVLVAGLPAVTVIVLLIKLIYYIVYFRGPEFHKLTYKGGQVGRKKKDSDIEIEGLNGTTYYAPKSMHDHLNMALISESPALCEKEDPYAMLAVVCSYLERSKTEDRAVGSDYSSLLAYLVDELKRGFGDPTVLAVNIYYAADYALSWRIDQVTSPSGVKKSEVEDHITSTQIDEGYLDDAAEVLEGTAKNLIVREQERLEQFLAGLRKLKTQFDDDENAALTLESGAMSSVSLPDNAAAVTKLPTIIYDGSQQAWYKQYAVPGNAVYRSKENGTEIIIRSAEISGSGANTDVGYFTWY